MDQSAFPQSIHSPTATIVMFKVRMAFEIYLGFSVGCTVQSANITIKDDSGCTDYQNYGT
jgi:hypothetical protein